MVLGFGLGLAACGQTSSRRAPTPAAEKGDSGEGGDVQTSGGATAGASAGGALTAIAGSDAGGMLSTSGSGQGGSGGSPESSGGDGGDAGGEPACEQDCVTPHCTPGLTGCIANRNGICAASGDALDVITADCAARGEACTAQQGCVPSVIDDFVNNNQSLQLEPFDGTAAANYVEVYSSRRITSLTVEIDLSDDVELRWQVAEWRDGLAHPVASASTFLKYNASTTTTSSLDCILEAGKRYQLSVTPLTPVARFLHNALPQPPLSFGRHLQPGPAPRTYAMSIVTTLP